MTCDRFILATCAFSGYIFVNKDLDTPKDDTSIVDDTNTQVPTTDTETKYTVSVSEYIFEVPESLKYETNSSTLTLDDTN